MDFSSETGVKTAQCPAVHREATEEANRADSPCDETEGSSNSGEQDSNCDLDKEKMPALQKAVQRSLRTSRPQTDKMSTDSDNTHSSIGKASSSLTASEQRSTGEASSSIKESDCASGSNVSQSHYTTSKNYLDCGGLFVPIHMVCQSRPSPIAPWVENANFGDHVCMRYQRHFMNSKEILQQTRDTMHSIQQPSGLHLQLRELFMDATSSGSVASSEEEVGNASTAHPTLPFSWQHCNEDDAMQRIASLGHNEQSDEGIDNCGSQNEGRSPEEGNSGTGSGGNTGSGDLPSSQYAESGFSSMKTAKQSPSSGGTGSDTVPQKVGSNLLTGEWKDSPDMANRGRTYPDKGYLHLPEFNLHIVREGAAIMKALFSETGTDFLESTNGLCMEG